jgi:hypothetical protein
MRNILHALLSIVLLLAPASAMQKTDIPPRFGIPWANSAGAPYVTYPVPTTSQIGITNCAASLPDGFPPLTFVPASAGGCPPFGKDFNGILKQITLWSRWLAAAGPVAWDATFNAQVGGYPKGAMVQSNIILGRLWVSVADNNSTNPDATDGTAANWVIAPGVANPGQLIQTLGNGLVYNAVLANGLTIGNAASNATNRASVDTFWLFVRIWTDCPNTQCQLFNSGGGAVSRGASAIADWNANNAISTYAMNGSATIASDAQGSVTTTRLSGIPVVSGSRTVAGSILGENLHTLLSSEVPATPFNYSGTTSGESNSHTHAFGAYQTAGSGAGIGTGGVAQSIAVSFQNTGTESANHTHAFSIAGAISGGGSSHNTVPRSFLTSNWLSL